MSTTIKSWYSPILKGGLASLVAALILIFVACFVNIRNGEPVRRLTRRSVDDNDQFLDWSSQPDQGIRQGSEDTEQVIYLKLRWSKPVGDPHTHSQPTPDSYTYERVYEWAAWGKTWALRLWGDANFLAPTFLVREDRDQDSWVGLPHDHAHCFARGRVEEEPMSDAALNVCGGLNGVIRIGGLVYTIEPLRTAPEVQPHTKEDTHASQRTSQLPPNSDSYNSDRKDESDINNLNYDSQTFGTSDFQNGGQSESSDGPDPPFKAATSLVHDPTTQPHLLRLLTPPGATGPEEEGYSHDGSQETGEQLPPDPSPHQLDGPDHLLGENISVSPTGSSYITGENKGDFDVFSDFEDYLRPKRFIFSKRHTIEVMVVVDHKMAHYHGKHVDQYVLTLMSVVSLIFRDSSIGNNLDIAVVEVVKPEGKSFAPKKAYENYAAGRGKSAEEMLKMFCKWQKQGLKYNEDHPHRYDTALLITRENICRNPYTQRCDTLGLAELGTMCSRYASCAIVQDNGLSAAFTIAHELGHLLNMPHDNDDKCSKFRGTGKNSPEHMNVMSRMLDHNTLPWIWSNCSRYYLSEYFQAGSGDCLEDEPWSNQIVEDDVEFTLAGELFSATQQCQYVFGKTSSICPYMPKCKRLWCTTTLDEKEGCRTQHMPWADGTPCDKNRWCLRGECTPKNREELRKVDGQWGAWQSWGACSRTCGVGVRRSERFCDSPKPVYGGHFCVGERVRYESCKLMECPLGALDFRSQQCKQFNGKNFGLRDIPEEVKWIPKYAERREDSCKLFCQAHNSGISYQLKEKVEDGTPCGPGTYDICVGGKCRVAGCDYVLNSTLKDDWCGICNGDNSTCQKMSGSLEDVRPWGYSDIHVIPEGAARIEILQKSYHNNPADDNYLALVDYETGEYLLNGNWVVTPFEKLVEFGGSLFEYTGSNQATERINSTKPLKKKLLVQILSVGKLYPPNVHYSYSKSNQDTEPEYVWQMSEWTECSRPCVGHSEQTSFCIRADTQARVADFYCSNTERPLGRRKSCALSCAVHWSYSEWEPCSMVGKSHCVKQREVKACVTSEETAVEVDRCADQTPVTEMDCEKQECPVWQYSGWTPCSCPPNTYRGQKKRLYACYMRNRPVNEYECRNLNMPFEDKTCPCWRAGEWGSCTSDENPTVLELRRPVEEAYPRPPIKGVSSRLAFDRRAYKSLTVQATSPNDYSRMVGKGTSCPRGKKRRIISCGPAYDSSPDHLCDSPKPSEVSLCQVLCTTTTTSTTSATPSTNDFAVAATTQVPQKTTLRYRSDTKNKKSSYNSDLSSIKSNARFYLPKSKTKVPRGPAIKGGFIKGEKKEKGNLYDDHGTTNEIANSLPTHHNDLSNRVVIGDRDQDVFSDRYDRVYDSGEEENNNLVKGHQDVDDTYLWQTGRWTECSKDCGGGERRRQVSCAKEVGRCPLHSRPADSEPCNMHPCTEWTHLEWGKCHPNKRNPCRGRKHRTVFCRDQLGREVTASHCLKEDRPTRRANCRLPCDVKKRRLRNRYKWRKGPWTTCSETCGGGRKFRNITCIDNMAGRVIVHNDYCLRYNKRQPLTQRTCNKQPCPYRWVAGEWSQCSWRCGPGIQTRDVTCHRVTPLGWVDPDPVEGACRRREVPLNRRECNMGFCSDSFFWVTRPWKPCQGLCGSKGRQRRSVICVDSLGVRVQRSKCRRHLRPRRRQRCRAKPCGHDSCVQARSTLEVYLDGEYSLLVGGVNMSIFCYGMNTTEPKEFLTLPAGEEGNYAEIYDKRLLRPDTCPFNGERRESCHCVADESGRAGLTTFSKIRINTTSLAVNTFDFTFARVVTGRLIAYGEAGDCYSMTQCPQGSFSINLAGTLLKVSDRTIWRGHGNKAVHWIHRLDESQRILGRCGGYCGTCTPDPYLGLKLDIRMTTNMSTKKET